MREGYQLIPGHVGCYSRPLASRAEGEGVDCALGYVEPGGGGPDEPHLHKHDHLIVVLDGAILLKQGGRESVMQAPAALRIDGNAPHSIWNAAGKVLELVMVNLPPVTAATLRGGSRLEEMRELAFSFCNLYLDEEYHDLCAELIDRMAEMPETTFLSGRAEIWAGGVIHALGSINNLFRKNAKPHVAQGDLACFFGATQQAIANRGRQLRDMFDLDYMDPDFSTELVSRAREVLASLLEPGGGSDREEMEKLAMRIQLSRGRGLTKARSARNRKRQFDRVYQFKIRLLETKPPIWRRILVPGDYNFWDLHVAIQDAMGWLDGHLHHFEMKRPGGTKREMIGMPDEDSIYFEPGGKPVIELAGWEEKVKDWFTEQNGKAMYEYDFGDGWEHEVILEKILPRELGMGYPACIGGAKACPPEDCGGVYGYYELLEILRDPSHPEHESMLTWVGPYFQPDEFSPDEMHFDNPYERFLSTFSHY